MSNMKYADDTTVVASLQEEMVEPLQKIENINNELGLS